MGLRNIESSELLLTYIRQTLPGATLEIKLMALNIFGYTLTSKKQKNILRTKS